MNDLACQEMTSVSFHGDTILAVRLPDGDIKVSIKKLCESVGTAFQSQLERLKSSAWAGVTMIVTPDSRGNPQETSVISYRKIPQWMASINANKVSESTREKLVAYQNEAADVLAKHFLDEKQVETVPAPLPKGIVVSELLRGMYLVAVEQERLTERVNAVESVAQNAVATAEKALAVVTGGINFMPVRGYNNVHKLGLSGPQMSSIGKALSKHCDANGIAYRKIHDDSYGQVNTYPVDTLEKWFSEHGW